jgi:hypothetical protein
VSFRAIDSALLIGAPSGHTRTLPSSSTPSSPSSGPGLGRSSLADNGLYQYRIARVKSSLAYLFRRAWTAPGRRSLDIQDIPVDVRRHPGHDRAPLSDDEKVRHSVGTVPARAAPCIAATVLVDHRSLKQTRRRSPSPFMATRLIGPSEAWQVLDAARALFAEAAASFRERAQ